MPKGRRSPSPVRAYGARKHENGVRKREEGFLYPNGFIARCLRFACLLVSTRDKDPKRSAFVFPGPAPSSLEINSFFSVKTSQRLISMQRNPLFFCFVDTPSIAFRYPPPDSARIGYATEWDILHLYEAVHRRCQRPPKGLGTNKTRNTTMSRIVQELCESRGDRPGLSVLTSLLVSVDVKLY